MKQEDTREAWLLRAIERLRPIFSTKGHHIPQTCMVSCGFASTGTRSHHIGQCWSTKSSGNGTNQIFISPTLVEPFDVLDTLVHELVHAVDDCAHKHGKEFKKIALSLGMVGPMRSAGAGPELKVVLTELATRLGSYPHGKLLVSHKKVVHKPRPRARCKKCGYEVPMFRKFLSYGPPLCPKDKIEMSPLGDWDEI
jgi:predicted Zn-ribbon and HTH transcriptional regulator